MSARWLKQYGHEVTIFESHDRIGGQWSSSNRKSGIWPEMRTNTFKGATCFSDLSYPDGVPMFPHNRQVLDYLNAYAGHFGLYEQTRCATTVTSVAPEGPGFRVEMSSDRGPQSARYDRVVVASGRFNRPAVPQALGAQPFTGRLGAIHTFDYPGAATYRDADVVIAGGSISALEVASELAMGGAANVYLAQRRQRYVVPKMVAGVPFEYLSHTYGAALAAGQLSSEEAGRRQKELVLRLAGDPASYGAPSPHEDVAKAGFTTSSYYLNLVAEGRITPVPWIRGIESDRIVFDDGSTVRADALIFGTGFDLSLPYLSDGIARSIHLDPSGLDLHEFTFHPDVPGLAFLGLWYQLGSYFCPLEQQARYLAYAWSGVVSAPSAEELRAGVDRSRHASHRAGTFKQNDMALRFARLNGSDPAMTLPAQAVDGITASATTGLVFRLEGPDHLPDGLALLQRQMSAFRPKMPP